MKTWITRLFGSAPAPVPAPRTRPAASAVRPVPGAHTAVSAGDPLAALRQLAPADAVHGTDADFFRWLVDARAYQPTPSGERERQALSRLDKLIAQASAGTSLLPRSAAVVPKLLARLRGNNVSLPELSEQISRDLTLVAEVLRMANSTFYRPGEAVVEVEQAIRVLGVEGLRKAIARAVLKPLMDAPSGKEVALATQRLWEHTDKKAQLCSAVAHCLGQDAFEGYLLGLVHNAVWSVVLRAVDGLENLGSWQIDEAFVVSLTSRRDRLFGLIARQWQLSESLTRVAAQMARPAPGLLQSPQMLLLHAGHQLASVLCGQGTVPPEALLADVGRPLRECFSSLARPAPDTPSRPIPQAAGA